MKTMNNVLEKQQINIKNKIKNIGFIGVGWIGRHRMKAILNNEKINAIAVADIDENNLNEAIAECKGDPECCRTIEEMIALGPDGIVIATPSAMHAEQAIQALRKNIAVFCQKPLGRNAAETARVIEAAREYNTLLGVDMSYRYTDAVKKICDLIHSGELGNIYAVDLVFHNAYGPDKPWFYNPQLSGGGCLIDLGVHMIDLALWVLNFPEVEKVDSHLFSNGRALTDLNGQVEDYVSSHLALSGDISVHLSCSWNLPAGKDAEIGAWFYGTKGGAAFKNVNGSFYDFTAEHYNGTQTKVLSSPPDKWGGRAAVDWSENLANGASFDNEINDLVKVATVIDRIYGRQ